MNGQNTQIALFDDSKRVVANLMARENISVQIVDGIPTASFDPITRVLSIPAWSQMTVAQIDTLMSHEVGHALFSDNSLYEKMRQDKAKRGFFTYFNVVEDARIERKMRESFPGLARVMHAGYKEFYANGPAFQGTVDGQSLINPRTKAATAINSMRFIDRINVHFKVGAFCHVTFSPEERVWVERITKCASMEEAITIARALYDLAKDNETPEPKDNPSNTPQPKKSTTEEQDESDESGDDAQGNDSQDDQDGDTEDSDDQDSDGGSTDGDESDDESDEDGDTTSGDEASDDEGDDESNDSTDGDDESDEDQDGESKSAGDDESDEQGDDEGTESAPSDDAGDQSGQGAGAGDGDGDESDPSAETAEQFEEALKDLAKSGDDRIQIRNLLISPVDDKTFAARTVSATDWTEKCYAKFALSANHQTILDGFVREWEEKHLSTAKLMALEFERRKTAKALMSAKTSKTGKLNLSKLSQYRYTEDLFLRSMTVPTGKSHGIVMVIDASGSMSGCFANVIDQVLLFAHFAFQVNIPFEAYMFTDRTESQSYDWRAAQNPEHRPGLHQIALSDGGRLVGLVNTRTSRGQFKRQVRACLALRSKFDGTMLTHVDWQDHAAIQAVPYSNLGGTPLYTGVMLGERALGNMKREAKLDKTTFIVVTDGQDGNGLEYTTHSVDKYTGAVTETQNRVGDTAIVVRDTVTKKQFSYIMKGDYGMACPSTGVISMLLDVIKARHDARTIYLFLQEGAMTTTTGGHHFYGRRRRFNRWANPTPQPVVTHICGLEYLSRNLEVAIDTASAVKSLKDDGQFVLPKDRGVADLSIILRQHQIVLSDDAFAKLDTTAMTQRKVAAEFTKTMVKSVANRVFVGTVIGHLA